MIEFCRNVLGLEGANSTEFEEEARHQAVIFMPEISKTSHGWNNEAGCKTDPFLG